MAQTMGSMRTQERLERSSEPEVSGGGMRSSSKSMGGTAAEMRRDLHQPSIN